MYQVFRAGGGARGQEVKINESKLTIPKPIKRIV